MVYLSEIEPLLIDPRRPIGESLRRLNWEYELGRLAPQRGEVRAFMGRTIQLAAVSAVANIDASVKLGELGRAAQVGFGDVTGQLNQVIKGQSDTVSVARDQRDLLGRMYAQQAQGNALAAEQRDLLRGVREDLSRTADLIEAQSNMLAGALDEIVGEICQTNELLTEVLETMRQPYKTKQLELVREAAKWVGRGVRSRGAARVAHYQDAFDLLTDVIKNPIGRQDYSVWFDLGWLGRLVGRAAEETAAAFDRAARLAEGEDDWYFERSVMHRANLFYEAGEPDKALDCLIGVARQSGEAVLLYDAARYLCLTGQPQAARPLLSEAIGLDPQYSLIMFSEPDFSAHVY